MTEPTDADRYPTLSEAGQRMLRWLREHEAAPIYRNASGNRLRAEDLDALRDFQRETMQAAVEQSAQGEPAWLGAVIEQAYAEVPHYRAQGRPPARFEDIPPVSRAELSADIARFVPDSLPLDRLINFRTTGTTGHPLLIPSHPQVAGRYLAFHLRALQRYGIAPTHGAGQVGVVLLGYQRRCFTYISVTPQMAESGLAKLNLHPDDWRDPAHPSRYLEALAPEFIAGDPISFAELLKLPAQLHPRALLSVSMALSGGLRQQLEQRYACPVLDLYSMNEVGPIAVHDAAAGGHVLLQPHLFVEILDSAGRRVPAGERGEITVSGGFNFCLPLLRYRTGDHASLAWHDGEALLRGLSGRRPVRFQGAGGDWFNNIDVTHALDRLPLSHYRLHQQADRSCTLQLAAGQVAYADQAIAALRALLGDVGLRVGAIVTEDKLVQYSSELEDRGA